MEEELNHVHFENQDVNNCYESTAIVGGKRRVFASKGSISGGNSRIAVEGLQGAQVSQSQQIDRAVIS